VPILPVDLTLPAGKMPADWHATDALQEWIAQGYASAPLEATTEQADAIATAYAYWRGYEAKAATWLGSPDNVGLGDMSVAQSNGRYDRMMAKAEEYRVEWGNAIASVTVVVPVVTLRQSGTVSVPLNFRWGV
jgi:hypothetical protein